MCGFIAVYGKSSYQEKNLHSALIHLKNRGPDAQKVICNSDELLGFARLSIRDLSNDGMQPMYSEDSNYSIVFNGEIYNYFTLREILISDGVEIHTKCDTEVLFKYFLKYGIEKTLSDIEGMFAFSINDKKNGKIYFARDLIGEKPLFYQLQNENIIISSNLYSIMELTKCNELNLQSVSNFLHYGYCKGLSTPIKGVYKLEPGSYSIFDTKCGSLNNISYRELRLAKNSSSSYDVEHFEKDLRRSIKNSLVADVPVGCFLSGGIDSSLVSLIAKEYKDDLKTFSVGFKDKNYDESTIAKDFANLIGTDHHEIILDKNEILQAIFHSKWVFDEPFADASFIAMLAVSKHARNYVTVCISGDGGDELFSGYNRHKLTSEIYRYRFIPKSIRKFFGIILRNGSIINALIKKIYNTFVSKFFYIQAFDEKIDKIAIALTFDCLNDLYFKILAGSKYNEQLGIPAPDIPEISNDNFRKLAEYDLFNYIHEDVLVKVDRSSMANSLEARAPLLNDRLVNFSLNCNKSFHIGAYGQKTMLKELLFRDINISNHFQSKRGFSVPYKSILDTDLKSSFYKMLSKVQELDHKEHFISEIRNLVDLYYEGKFHDYKFIWNAYFFISWYYNTKEIVNRDGMIP